MTEIIARFADGRLLVQEDRVVQSDTISGGYATVRIGQVRVVEKVLSLDAEISGYPEQKLATELRDVLVSGDTLRVALRRADLGVPVLAGLFSGLTGTTQTIASGICSGALSGSVTITGTIWSGVAALNLLSGITSGRGFYESIASGMPVSGQVAILANVIGY